MTQKTVMFHVRLTEAEKIGIQNVADKVGEKPSRLVRKWLREAINHEPDLLTDEASLLKIAIRQLIGTANNLNQIVAAINSGKAHRTIDQKYLDELIGSVNLVKESFKSHVLKTKNRWVKRA